MMEVVFRAAQLLVELGATVREAFPRRVEVTLGEGPNAPGLSFGLRLFEPRLSAHGDRLAYGLFPGTEPVHVEVLPLPLLGGLDAEADLERGVFPTAFWDRLWAMPRRSSFRRMVFREAAYDSLSLRLRVQVARERPSRENLLLERLLWTFFKEEKARVRANRREANARRRPAYEYLLVLTEAAPHSLNLLRKEYGMVRVRRIAPGYFTVAVRAWGEEFNGYGPTPVRAAAQARSFLAAEARRRGYC